MKAMKRQRKQEGVEGTEELLSEDFTWLSVMNDMISPYWSARVVAHPITGKRMVAVTGLRDGKEHVS